MIKNAQKNHQNVKKTLCQNDIKIDIKYKRLRHKFSSFKTSFLLKYLHIRCEFDFSTQRGAKFIEKRVFF